MKSFFAFLFLLGTSFAQVVTGGVVLTGSASGVSLVSISISPSAASIAVAGTQQFSDTETYSDGSIQNGQCSAWVSSSPSKATINSSGLATGVAAGSSNITCTLSGVTSATAVLTVTTSAVFTLLTSTLPNGDTTHLYTPQIVSSNGAAPCSWSITSGALPTNVTIPATSNPCSPMTLVDSVNPVAGTYNFHLHGVDNTAHTVDADYRVVISTLPCTAGPPNYLCTVLSNKTTLPPNGDTAVGTLNAASGYVFQLSDPVNTIRYDTTLNTFGTDCQVLLSDDRTFNGSATGNGTYTAGSGTQQASLNNDFIFVVGGGGASNILKLSTASTDANCPLSVVWPVPGSNTTQHVASTTVFSTVSDTRFFQAGGSGKATQLLQGTIVGGTDPTAFTTTQIFDYSWCPHTPGVGTTPLTSSGWDVGGADEFMAEGFSWAAFGDGGGQNNAKNMYIFRKSTGKCATIWFPQIASDQHFYIYDWCDPNANGHGSDHANCVGATPVATIPITDCVPPTTGAGMHSIDMSPSGDITETAIVCASPVKGSYQIYWNYGTGANVATTVFTCPNNGKCTGHGKIGSTGTVNANNPYTAFTVYPPPTGSNGSWPGGSSNIYGPWNGCGGTGEFHYSWENSPGDDTWDAILTTSACVQPLGLALSSPYLNEYIGIDTQHAFSSPARFGHNWTAGGPGSPAINQPISFGAMYGQHFVSQDGNWLFGMTSALCNFGLDTSSKGGQCKERVMAVHLQ